MLKRNVVALGMRLASIVVVASTAPALAQMDKMFINPAGGYTQVVAVEDRAVTTLYVSGQVGTGDDLQAHAESAFAGVAEQLAAAGASMADVVKIRIYVTDFDPDDYQIIAAARLAAFPDDAWPVSTMLGVNALARDEFRVEIEATAVVAAPGADFELTRLGPSRGFSQVVIVRHGAVKTIWVAGQVGQGEQPDGADPCCVRSRGRPSSRRRRDHGRSSEDQHLYRRFQTVCRDGVFQKRTIIRVRSAAAVEHPGWNRPAGQRRVSS